MNCENCGFLNRTGVLFCENCGQSLAVNNGNLRQTSELANRLGGSRNCGWIALILGGIGVLVLLVLIIGGLITFYFVSKGELSISVAPSPVLLATDQAVITVTQAQSFTPSEQTTETLPATATKIQSVTATLGVPMFTVKENAFCRKGPSMVYEDQTTIKAGDTVKIFGESGPEWEDWWYVEVSGYKCWVWSGLGTASGDMSEISVVQAPPTPKPTNTPVILPQTCTGTEGYGPIVDGTQVILGRHRTINGSDNWTSPDMDAFVGQTAIVTKLSGYDGQNCPGVRVDIDGEKWFWRVRDLTLP